MARCDPFNMRRIIHSLYIQMGAMLKTCNLTNNLPQDLRLFPHFSQKQGAEEEEAGGSGQRSLQQKIVGSSRFCFSRSVNGADAHRLSEEACSHRGPMAKASKG